ncbi:MAG TPA: hypothetical protein VGM69_01645 [Chloroflexota bacterium]
MADEIDSRVDGRPDGPRRSTPPSAGELSHLARDADAGTYLQAFLVAAVASVLLTRLYLEMTGYPRLGGGRLHIAHLLWGGLLMLLAQVLLLALLGKRAKRAAAFVGGAGFGLFVDELGKFVTADNDYFFEPAVALIYVVFVALFLTFRAIERRSLPPHALLANAADMVRELVLGGATRGEAARALRLLERSGARGPLADGIRAAVAGAAYGPEGGPARLARTALAAQRLYDRMVAAAWFRRAVVGLFVVQSVLGVVAALGLGWTVVVGESGRARVVLDPLEAGLIRDGVGTSLLSLALVTLGVARLRRDRLAAYRWWERSVLVAILVTQVILFWQDQLAALSGVIWNVVLLGVLRYLIHQEELRRAAAAIHDPTGRPPPVEPEVP